MFKVKIYINLKKEILDPQGLVVLNALHSLGYKEVKDLRVGKIITFCIDTLDEEVVKKKIEEMCKKILVNPIIENYEFSIEKV